MYKMYMKDKGMDLDEIFIKKSVILLGYEEKRCKICIPKNSSSDF